jgi:hypothetical protein
MIWTPDGYRLAALERLAEATALRRDGRYVLAMYVAGVAAEWRVGSPSRFRTARRSVGIGCNETDVSLQLADLVGC